MVSSRLFDRAFFDSSWRPHELLAVEDVILVAPVFDGRPDVLGEVAAAGDQLAASHAVFADLQAALGLGGCVPLVRAVACSWRAPKPAAMVAATCNPVSDSARLPAQLHVLLVYRLVIA